MLITVITEATKARSVFEQHANQIDQNLLGSFPSGACGTASDFLGNWLTNKGLNGIEYVCGERNNQTHGWLEYNGYIIDITCDQFNDFHKPVFVSMDRTYHDQFTDQVRNPNNVSDDDIKPLTRFTHLMNRA